MYCSEDVWRGRISAKRTSITCGSSIRMLCSAAGPYVRFARSPITSGFFRRWPTPGRTRAGKTHSSSRSSPCAKASPLPRRRGCERQHEARLCPTILQARAPPAKRLLMHTFWINGFCKRVVSTVDVDTTDDGFVVLGDAAGDLITHDGMGIGVRCTEQG